METFQLILPANQFTSFYMMATLAFLDLIDFLQQCHTRRAYLPRKSYHFCEILYLTLFPVGIHVVLRSLLGLY